MIGTDGVTVARPDGQPESLATPLPDVLAEFESEFFVEWQVADHARLGRPTGEVNPL